MLRRIFDAYGPSRLCWGSDFPASKRFCTFRQSLEAVRTHCRFLTAEDLSLVLGGTLRAVLRGRHGLKPGRASARGDAQAHDPGSQLAPGLETLEMAQALVDHEGEEAAPALFGDAGDVRGDEDVRKLHEGRVGRQRLGVEDIQTGNDVAALQAVQERDAVHDLSPGDVDEDAPGLELVELARPRALPRWRR